MSDPGPTSHFEANAGSQAAESQATESQVAGQIAEPQTTGSQTYEAAAARVEEIIRRLDSGEASLNETLALVAEGKALIELCASELEAVSGALEELRLDELVARLEREASA